VSVSETLHGTINCRRSKVKGFFHFLKTEICGNNHFNNYYYNSNYFFNLKKLREGLFSYLVCKETNGKVNPSCPYILCVFECACVHACVCILLVVDNQKII
jgi:hypothetical protein